MKKEKLRVVRVPPHSLPILDEIEKTYFIIANDKLEVDRTSPDLKFIDFEDNVVGIYYNAREYKEDDKSYFYNGTSNYDFLPRNTHLPNYTIFGDIIILGTYHKTEEDKQVEKYKSLTIEQIDQYIEHFKHKEEIKSARNTHNL